MRLLRYLAVAAALSGLGFGAVVLEQKKVLSSEVARQVGDAALKAAAANNAKVAVTVVDDGGHILFLQRMDEANPSAVDTSSAKAKSAVMYKQPTKNFADRLAKGETLVLKLEGAMPVEGGFPLVVDGKVIGGIGVGGAPAGQIDARIAQVAVDWFTANVK